MAEATIICKQIVSRASQRALVQRDKRCSMKLVLPLVAVGFCWLGCDSYAKPNRPLSSTFEARFLDGSALTAEMLKGAPTVINVWAPK